jgi:hypothetical protein
MVKGNLKVVEQSEKMDFRQMEQLANDFVGLFIDDQEQLKVLLFVFNEIRRNCPDWQYVEDLSSFLARHLFMASLEAEEALDLLARDVRDEWVGSKRA